MEDKRNSCTVYQKENFAFNSFESIVLNINDKIEFSTRKHTSTLLYSQAKPKEGIYTLLKISIKDIDVSIKGIANRDFFKFDESRDKHLTNLKNSFYQTDPVILEKFNGKYYSIDGHHRITVALELGLENILAFVIKVDKLTHPRRDR